MKVMKKIGLPLVFVFVVVIITGFIQSAYYSPVESSDNVSTHYNTEQKPMLILAGIDSLTNGPIYHKEKSRYLDDFIPRMHKYFGDGGPGYVPFDSIYFKQEHGEFHFSNGMKQINDLPPGQYPSQYSLDLKGMYTTGGWLNWMTVKFPKKWHWTYGKIFYLKQPHGGHFNVGYKQSDKALSVNTNSPKLGLGVIHLPKNIYNGQLEFSHINGKVAIFGGEFLNKKGVAVSRIGQGGDRLAWHALIDNRMMDEWLKQLDPELLMLNAGMNDRRFLSADRYRKDLTNYLDPYIKEKTEILLIGPNAILGDNTRLDQYRKVLRQYADQHHTGYISNQSALGYSYLEAQSKNLMGDRIHPNALGSKIISKHLFNYLMSNNQFASLFNNKDSQTR
ncbi:lysophospholipase L1-like esterase [Scopulibacillus daqui]|uniref:Lysophospholipase L1-like esterase n=2 Tax=Scopulibacillus daqui TaxID=1469162 RepID=A0ABS2PXR9_9BACL|nr:lysophospholipase L1-like esterase [Scopulibacillus daqui]